MTTAEVKLTGLVPSERVHPVASRADASVIARLKAVPDLTATLSDVLDGLGIRGTVGASTLRPTGSDAPLVGSAVTLRKVPRLAAPDPSAGSDLGEIEGANQCIPGDVLVVEGVPEISAMGGLMSTIAKRQGAVGAVVDGGVRDIAHARSIEFPIWSRDVTPITGKWRTEVASVGEPVTIAGCAVTAGDVVVADETGLVFIPCERAEEVCGLVEGIATAEASYEEALAASDLPLAELLQAFTRREE